MDRSTSVEHRIREWIVTVTVLYPNTFIFSSLETFALQRKQTSEVKIFFGVSIALVAHCEQIPILKLLLVPAASHVYVSVIFYQWILMSTTKQEFWGHRNHSQSRVRRRYFQRNQRQPEIRLCSQAKWYITYQNNSTLEWLLLRAQERPTTLILTVSSGWRLTRARHVYNRDPETGNWNFVLQLRMIRMPKMCQSQQFVTWDPSFCYPSVTPAQTFAGRKLKTRRSSMMFFFHYNLSSEHI